MLPLLIVDHRDSFTYNLVQYLGELGASCSVQQSDSLTSEPTSKQWAGILLSPGPGLPEDWPNTQRLLRDLPESAAVLGICLGHQAIAASHGARIVRSSSPTHGRSVWVEHDGSGCLNKLPSPLSVARYNSVCVDDTSLPSGLAISARLRDNGEVMGIRHRNRPIEGVQFHPESILTEAGKEMLNNWLESL
ncbi:MAG: aminodeoxychorismate/anthranilate synthase component II [Polyangiaceae bacterium]|nr:aminodeoxychorismate/anthranilate synthase component II [Polyangiaceae bacterium]